MFLGGDSKTQKTVKTTNVSDQGQLVGRSNIAQGGSTQLALNASGKNSKVSLNTGLQLGTTKGNVTVNQGVGEDTLKNLVGSLTTATQKQIDAVASSSAGNLSKLAGLLESKQDNEAGSPQKLTWIALAAVLGLAVLAYAFKKSR